ncbi:MAG: hypothetical protein WDO56_13930 [Gammaproteobacteria bacterium]
MSAAYGPLTLRYGRVQDQLTLDSAQANALIAGVRQAGFVSLADDLAVADKKSMFAGYGAALDWHNATNRCAPSSIPRLRARTRRR